jgi:hypothetical protein
VFVNTGSLLGGKLRLFYSAPRNVTEIFMTAVKLVEFYIRQEYEG